MQTFDKLSFILGVLISLMMIYFLIGLFPGTERRQQELERRLKSGGGTIIPMSRLRRVVAMLMCGMLATQLFAGAFHRNLSTVTGIPWPALFGITFLILPALVLFLGVRDKRHFKSKHGSDA